MSRGFPIDADELTTIGVKLEAAEDIERLQEFGLPTSTFLQETFPGEKVARLNACFAKILKKTRIELFYEDKEEHKIFLNYHQGAWRIAYFEDRSLRCRKRSSDNSEIWSRFRKRRRTNEDTSVAGTPCRLFLRRGGWARFND
eukprot:7052118-Pyramimonas_sp.AAC.1